MQELIELIDKIAKDVEFHAFIMESDEEAYRVKADGYFNEFRNFYTRVERHMYSEISNYLDTELQEDALNGLIMAMKCIVTSAEMNAYNEDPKDTENKNTYNKVLKLYDHISLEAKRVASVKQNLFITSEIKKQHGELGKQITEAKKTLQEAEGTAGKLSEQLISILGIFAGIIVTFSFAITTIGEALANATELNIKYLLLIVSILGVVFMNVISLLMSFVIKLSGRNIKTCIPWVVFGCTNLVLVALVVFFTLVM